MYPEYELLLRFFIAGAAGFFIGLEREAVHKPAGIRTHMVVGLGSAIFAIITIQAAPADIGRIVAGIATGIGFLGAGTIFKAKDEVHGLTTAASVWAVAAIGLAAGFGLYFVAITSTVLLLLVLHLVRINFFKHL